MDINDFYFVSLLSVSETDIMKVFFILSMSSSSSILKGRHIYWYQIGSWCSDFNAFPTMVSGFLYQKSNRLECACIFFFFFVISTPHVSVFSPQANWVFVQTCPYFVLNFMEILSFKFKPHFFLFFYTFF